MTRFLEINSKGLIIEIDGKPKVLEWDKLEKVVIKKISSSKFGVFNSATISYYLFFENGNIDLPENNDDFLKMRDCLFDYLGIQNVFFKIDFDINDEFLLYKKEL